MIRPWERIRTEHEHLIKDYETLTFDEQDNQYKITVHYEGSQAWLNVWGKRYPQPIFEQAIREVFSNPLIHSIHIERGRNPFFHFLQETNDIRCSHPEYV